MMVGLTREECEMDKEALGAEIRSLVADLDLAEAKRIESTVETGLLLLAARRHFSDSQSFAKWVFDQDVDWGDCKEWMAMARRAAKALPQALPREPGTGQ
jgi:hypothetical protein